MEIKLGEVHLSRVSAGLSIHENRIAFVELDESSNIIQKIVIPLPEGCVVNAQIKNFQQLEKSFERLYDEIGKIREPITIGLPAGEVIIQFLNFPKMNMEDVRGTTDLNFEEHFHFPRQEAVFDVIQVKTPADIRERDTMTVLAAAAKREVVEQILDAMWRAGLPAGPVEPLRFAMLRAIPEGQTGLSIFANPKNVIAIYEGTGIYFRNTTEASAVRDILSTIQYIESRNRGVKIEKIIFAGLNLDIDEQEDSGFKFIKVEDEFYAVEGLALRALDGIQTLDLRPMEFVELEKRRYHFNINRLILWSLVIIFMMLSIGTISFTYSCIQNLNYEMQIMRENVDEMTRQRMDIAAENARLEKQKGKIEKVLNFMKSDLPALEVLQALEASVGTGLKFDNADFIRNPLGGITVNIDGKAEDERSVLNMTEGLKSSGVFSSVLLPFSQKDMLGRIVFKLILTVGDNNNA